MLDTHEIKVVLGLYGEVDREEKRLVGVNHHGLK
jgi:hypothetical protein